MKSSKRNIIVFSIFVCSCIFLTISSCISSRSVKNAFGVKYYRIAGVKSYMSAGFSLPEIINDSTATLVGYRTFNYDDDQLVSVKQYIYKNDGSSYEYSSDSIIYENPQNVMILWKRNPQNEWDNGAKSGSFSMKAKEYFNSSHFINYVNDTKRCNEGCKLIEHSKKHYELNYAGALYLSYHYFLNDEGYIVKIGIESDTNASIEIYEYELGYNPYHLYYTFDVINY